nr:uncharacterized protein LOC127343474 [Lolium perenne]
MDLPRQVHLSSAAVTVQLSSVEPPGSLQRSFLAEFAIIETTTGNAIDKELACMLLRISCTSRTPPSRLLPPLRLPELSPREHYPSSTSTSSAASSTLQPSESSSARLRRPGVTKRASPSCRVASLHPPPPPRLLCRLQDSRMRTLSEKKESILVMISKK